MNRIKEFREKAGLRQTDLAAVAKEVDSRIDAVMISNFERGLCLPTPAVKKALAEAMGVPECALYAMTEQSYLDEILQSAEMMMPEIPFVIEELIKTVGKGKEHPTDRRWLARELDVRDRVLRDRIACARKYGFLICSTGDGRGYFLSDDINDIERYYHREKKRAMSILNGLVPFRKILKTENRL